jgi:toxin-antitoxin system PIN domain toxin
MIAVDTNVLVAAHRRDAPMHAASYALLERLGSGARPFGIFWPSLYEFLRVVTHHRVFNPPSSLENALAAMVEFISIPSARLLSETERHAEVLRDVLKESPVEGNLLHDAHLVALAVEHGVHEIVTYDRDFKRFSQVIANEPKPIK